MTVEAATLDLDALELRLAYLSSAARLLREVDADTEGFDYIVEKVAQDIDAMVDPLQRLIMDRQLAIRARRTNGRKRKSGRSRRR